jgi:hypothetical protein
MFLQNHPPDQEEQAHLPLYQDKPRLKTALQLLRTSMDVEDSLSEVIKP